jgi:uncharacterized membrane protein
MPKLYGCQAGHNGTMTSTDIAQRDSAQKTATRMGAGLVGMGILHFAAPKPFDGIIPAELPGPARFYTHASGVAELGVGVMLLAPRTRKLGALAAVALFLGVLPGNINMVRLWWDKPWYMRAGAIARVPMQIPMITTALKVYRNS